MKKSLSDDGQQAVIKKRGIRLSGHRKIVRRAGPYAGKSKKTKGSETLLKTSSARQNADMGWARVMAKLAGRAV